MWLYKLVYAEEKCGGADNKVFMETDYVAYRILFKNGRGGHY